MNYFGSYVLVICLIYPATCTWDYLEFAQVWPISECIVWKEESHPSCGKVSEETVWTIHGLWPSKTGSKGPFFCNSSWHFDPEEIKPIEDELMERFGTIQNVASPYTFWAHEWSKHGTCAATIAPLNSQLKYFNKTIELNKAFAIEEVLASSGITPSNDETYDIQDINSALTKRFGVTPAVTCHNEKGRDILVQILLCFDKNFVPINCAHEIQSSMTNCQSSGVTYPSSVTHVRRFKTKLGNSKTINRHHLKKYSELPIAYQV